MDATTILLIILIVLTSIILLGVIYYLYYKKQQKKNENVAEMVPNASSVELIKVTSNSRTSNNLKSTNDATNTNNENDSLYLWSNKIEMIQYYDKFIDNGFMDTKNVYELTNNDLAHRKCIMQNIQTENDQKCDEGFHGGVSGNTTNNANNIIASQTPHITLATIDTHKNSIISKQTELEESDLEIDKIDNMEQHNENQNDMNDLLDLFIGNDGILNEEKKE